MPPFPHFDFGLTALAGRFHQDWSYDGTPSDILADLLGTIDPEEVGVLRDDARLALAGLSAEQVETLWLAGTSNFEFRAYGGVASGPVWLETIIEGCDRWFAEHSSVPPQRQVPDLVDEVAAFIVPIVETVGDRWGNPPAGEITAALLRCAHNCSADLAFRFLMRIIIQEASGRLTADQFRRLQLLSDRFEYGEYIVGDAEFLIE